MRQEGAENAQGDAGGLVDERLQRAERRLLFSVNSFALMFYSAFNRQHSLFCPLLKLLLFAA